MKSIFLTTAVTIAMSATASFAQNDSATAMEIARAQDACGENGTIVSARFLEDGRVGVRCARPAGILGGGGGAAGGAVATNFVPIAGGLFAVVLGAAAIGNSSSTSDTQ